MQFDLKYNAPTFAGLIIREASRENLNALAAVVLRGSPYKDDQFIVTPRQIASSDVGKLCLMPVKENPEYAVRYVERSDVGKTTWVQATPKPFQTQFIVFKRKIKREDVGKIYYFKV